MMKKTKLLMTSMMLAVAFIGFSSFVDDGDGGAGACDQCVVKAKVLGFWKTVYSCKTMANESCSKSGTDDNGQTWSVSCANAKEC
jgi:hypothetical protein